MSCAITPHSGCGGIPGCMSGYVARSAGRRRGTKNDGADRGLIAAVQYPSVVARNRTPQHAQWLEKH
jgi:hypothetical protein